MNEVKPEELLNDLNHFQNLKDLRLLILILHLYSEHFIQELSREKRIKLASVIDKSKKLAEIKIINDEHVKVIELIYDARNELMHHLHPDFKLIERWILDFRPIIKTDNKQLLEALEKTNAWGRIQLYAIPVIFTLFRTLKEIKKEPIEHDMIIELKPDNKFYFKLFKIEKEVKNG